MNYLYTPALILLAGMTLWPGVGLAQTASPALPGDDTLVDDVLADDPGQARAPNPTQGMLLYRVWGEQLSAPNYGTETEDAGAIRQYLRGHVGLVGEAFEIHAEADIVAGQLYGDAVPQMPARADTDTRASRDLFDTGRLVDPREFYAQWNSPAGQLRAGLQTSQWGLGIIAHSGAVENEGLFNQNFGGDRVLRTVFATAPLRPLLGGGFTDDIYLAVGADLVWRDENADLLAGDRAWQGMAAAFYRTDTTHGGLYAVYRDQDDRNDDFLRVWVFDAFADHSFSPVEDFTFRAAAEVALMNGESSRTWSQHADPISVLALGAAGELEGRYEPVDVGLQLRAGYASGDANSDDDTLYRFRFDPNYHVGMVLFDHYLPAVNRASVAGIFDPNKTGYAPRGIDGLLSDGGVENAIYLSPRLLYGREDGFLAGVSFLWAKAAQPLFDPYKSFENGGALVGINGRKTASDDLGVELDAAAQYRFNPVDALTLEIKGEYGIFFPGEAFADVNGDLEDPQNLMRLRLSAIW